MNPEFRPPGSPHSIPRNLCVKEPLVKGVGPGRLGAQLCRAFPEALLLTPTPIPLVPDGGEEPQAIHPPVLLSWITLPLRGWTLGGSKHREDSRGDSYCRARSGWVWGQGGSWWVGKLPQGLSLGPCNSCQPPPSASLAGSVLNLPFLNLLFHFFLS